MDGEDGFDRGGLLKLCREIRNQRYTLFLLAQIGLAESRVPVCNE